MAVQTNWSVLPNGKLRLTAEKLELIYRQIMRLKRGVIMSQDTQTLYKRKDDAMNDKSREAFEEPAFYPGDIVEVIAYQEWKGQPQLIAEVRRRIRDGKDCGYWTYGTWPISGKEGITDEWQAEHLRLIKRQAAEQRLLGVLESEDLKHAVALAIEKSIENARLWKDGKSKNWPEAKAAIEAIRQRITTGIEDGN